MTILTSDIVITLRPIKVWRWYLPIYRFYARRYTTNDGTGSFCTPNMGPYWLKRNAIKAAKKAAVRVYETNVVHPAGDVVSVVYEADVQLY